MVAEIYSDARRLNFSPMPDRPNRAQNWPLCLEYDSQIRRRAHISSIDPSAFHIDIWNELESVHIAKGPLRSSGVTPRLTVALGAPTTTPLATKTRPGVATNLTIPSAIILTTIQEARGNSRSNTDLLDKAPKSGLSRGFAAFDR
ncbi:hypothetical protein B0H11DRAFT_2218090 [Mycena galericulata]|nr:hypothetical protein B0H11DRAFT_2218090 [Mycena galericulata]